MKPGAGKASGKASNKNKSRLPDRFYRALNTNYRLGFIPAIIGHDEKEADIRDKHLPLMYPLGRIALA